MVNSKIDKIDWASDFMNKNTEAALDYFYMKINNTIKEHVPSKICRHHSYPVWYSSCLQKIIKEKSKFHKKFKKYGNISDLNAFKLLRERVKRVENECYNKYIETVEGSI
jgi:hypothetical protein